MSVLGNSLSLPLCPAFFSCHGKIVGTEPGWGRWRSLCRIPTVVPEWENTPHRMCQAEKLWGNPSAHRDHRISPSFAIFGSEQCLIECFHLCPSAVVLTLTLRRTNALSLQGNRLTSRQGSSLVITGHSSSGVLNQKALFKFCTVSCALCWLECAALGLSPEVSVTAQKHGRPCWHARLEDGAHPTTAVLSSFPFLSCLSSSSLHSFFSSFPSCLFHACISLPLSLTDSAFKLLWLNVSLLF